MEREDIGKDEDSVPSDFFDDFSNQDFMAGLDVVDAWDEESPKNKGENKSESTQKKNDGRKSPKYRHTIRSRRRRSSSKTYEKSNRDTNKDSLKRDPEKTKRDIQNDKDKWTKNNRAKIITERLKVVETGLVPPGTEMDEVVTELNTVDNVTDLREKIRKRSPSFDLSTRLTNRSRRSPPRKRNRTRSPIRQRGSQNRRYSPIYRSNKVSRGHTNSPPMRERGSASPRGNYPRSRQRSVSLRESSFEREYPPRDRRYFSPSRNRWRSPSPSRRNYRHSSRGRNDTGRNAQKGFLEELADKLNYDEQKKKMLWEIGSKLNESSRPVYSYAAPSMVVRPDISRPPHFLQSVTIPDPAPQYDQSFFIGNSKAFPSSNESVISPIIYDLDRVGPQIVPQPVTTRKDLLITVPNNSNLTVVQGQSTSFSEDKKAASKLLEDKGISLSDFLTVSAKSNHISNPLNIHKKVKVLALCQDALKALGNSSQLNGRFFYKQQKDNSEKKTIGKYLSPLGKIPVTHFAYTTPWKGVSEVKTIAPIQKLLASIGLPLDSGIHKTEPNETNTSTNNNIDSDVVYVSTESAPPGKPSIASIIGIRFQTKMSQTDILKCEKCEKRNSIKFSQTGVQCAMSSVNIGTQVTEDDFYRNESPSTSTKRSLAHLTPAQLLGRDGVNSSVMHERGLDPGRNLSSQMPLNAFQTHNSGRSNFMVSKYDRDPSVQSNNRVVEFRETSPAFIAPRHFQDNHLQDRFIMDDNVRMHQQNMLREEEARKPFFEPPAQRDDFFSHNNYAPRRYF